jgi:RHS repeat-associated protein
VNIATYSYDNGNRVDTRTYQNGVVADFTYDANNRITSLTHNHGATLIAGFTHQYDDEGNKKNEEKLHQTGASEAYAYDSIYRLVDYKVGPLVAGTVPVPVTQTAYNLDAVGNWNSKTTDSTVQTRMHNAANEITAIDSTSITHDHNGNLTGDGQFSHEYDENNRLIRVTQLSDSIVVGEYVYDALGRRVIKLADGDGDSIQTETRFYYDDARAIEDQDGIGTTLAIYVFGNYVDEVLTMDRLGSRYFYHQNTLWSPHAITDATGTVVERYSYDAYGKVTVTDGLGVPVADNPWGTPHSVIGNRITFTGRELDEETGLYFYRARIYDCVKGRFHTRDPLGYVAGINLYQYATGCPSRNADPSGYLDFDPTLTFNGESSTYSVSANGWSGSFGSNGGALSYSREFDLAEWFGDVSGLPGGLVYFLGGVQIGVTGSLSVQPVAVSKSECSSRFTPVDNEYSISVHIAPPGSSFHINGSHGNAIETSVSLRYKNYGILHKWELTESASLNVRWWSDKLCGCFCTNGSLESFQELTLNPAGIAFSVVGIPYLAAELSAAGGGALGLKAIRGMAQAYGY